MKNNKLEYDTGNYIVKQSSEKWFGVFKKDDLFNKDDFITHSDNFKFAKKIAKMLQNAYNDGYYDNY